MRGLPAATRHPLERVVSWGCATTSLWAKVTLPPPSCSFCTTSFISVRFSAQRGKQIPGSEVYQAVSTQTLGTPHPTVVHLCPMWFWLPGAAVTLAWSSQGQCLSLQSRKEIHHRAEHEQPLASACSSTPSGCVNLLAFRAGSSKVLNAIWHAQSSLFLHTHKEVSSF